jgi:hypothetical protein
LLGGLDALGDRPQAQGVSETDHRFNDRCVLRLFSQPVDKGFVYLYHVHREALEVGEVRVTGAEVVYSDPYPQVFEPS